MDAFVKVHVLGARRDDVDAWLTLVRRNAASVKESALEHAPASLHGAVSSSLANGTTGEHSAAFVQSNVHVARTTPSQSWYDQKSGSLGFSIVIPFGRHGMPKATVSTGFRDIEYSRYIFRMSPIPHSRPRC